MSQWDLKGWKKCTKCGTMKPEPSLPDGQCADANWCDKQTAIPSMIAQDWARIHEDMRSLGCAGFEVEGKKYVLYSVSGGETVSSEVDDE